MEKFVGPAPVGYTHSLPMIRREPKVPGRREEALARATASARSAASCVKPRGRPMKVGHHAAVPRPKRFYVQLDKDDLYMLVIPEEFRTYVKGRPYPQLLIIQGGKECEWVVEANLFKDAVVLDNGWPRFAAFHDLKENDYIMLKVIANGFKITMYDRITSCKKVMLCREHADLN